MARYQATVASQSPAAETFGYLAAFSNAAEWDPGVLDREVVLHAANAVLRSTVVTGAADGSTVSYDAVRLRGPLRVLDPLLQPGFRAVAERAAAGLTDALSRRPPGGGTRTAAAAPDSSGGAAEPAGGRP